MSIAMSYQYPSQPLGGPEMDLSQASYMPMYQVPSQQPPSSMADPRTSHLALQDSVDPNRALRRSFSTPNAMPFPGGPMDHSQSGTAGEKKRNKLGYHRTSVACVHCRRRKIRCVPDNNDVHNRCTNCIRLKKDCNFQPVEQPSPVDTRAKPNVRGSASQQDPSASASPATSNGQPHETPSKRPFSGQIMPSPANHFVTRGLDDEDHASLSETTSANQNAGQAFDFANQQTMPPWAPDEPSPSSEIRDSNYHSHWQAHAGGSTVAEHYPHYGHVSQPSPGWQGEISGTQPQEGFPWSHMSVPVRSMSYSGEGMPGSHPGHFTHSDSYDRRSSNVSGIYNPVIGVPLASMEPGSHQSIPTGRGFPPGTVPPPEVGVWSAQAEPSPLQASFPKQGSYEGWAYGGQANGH